jgi:hypothetical protein
MMMFSYDDRARDAERAYRRKVQRASGRVARTPRTAWFRHHPWAH